MDIDFYILYWFMYHISIFNRSDLLKSFEANGLYCIIVEPIF